MAKKPKKHRRRWLRVLGCACLAPPLLIFCLLLALHVGVLQKALLEAFVLPLVQSSTGIEASFDDFSLGFLNPSLELRVRIDGVQAKAAGKPILTLRTLRLRVPLLSLLGTPLVEAALQDPEIWLSQDEHGQWNLPPLNRPAAPAAPAPEPLPEPGPLVLPEAKIESLKVDGLKLHFQAPGMGVDLGRLDLTADLSLHDLSGGFQLRLQGIGGKLSGMPLDVKDVTLSGKLLQGRLQSSLAVLGPGLDLGVEAALSALIPPSGLDATARLKLQTSELPPGLVPVPLPATLELEARATGEPASPQLELKSLSLRTGETRLTASGKLSPRLEADLKLDLLAPRLAEFSTLAGQPLQGALTLSALVQGPVLQPSGRVEFRLDDGLFGTTPLAASGALALKSGNLTIEGLAAAAAGAEVELTGQAELARMLAGERQASVRLDISKLLAPGADLGPTTLSAGLALDKASFDLKTLDGKLTASGSYDLAQASFDVRALLQELELGRLRPELAGSASFDVTASGPVASPVVRGSLDLKRVDLGHLIPGPRPAGQEISGLAGLHVDFDAPEPKLEAVRANVRIEQLEGRAGTLDFSLLHAPSVVTLKPGALLSFEGKGLEVALGGKDRLSLRGAFELAKLEGSGNAGLRLDLAKLSTLAGQKLSGVAEFGADFRAKLDPATGLPQFEAHGDVALSSLNLEPWLAGSLPLQPDQRGPRVVSLGAAFEASGKSPRLEDLQASLTPRQLELSGGGLQIALARARPITLAGGRFEVPPLELGFGGSDSFTLEASGQLEPMQVKSLLKGGLALEKLGRLLGLKKAAGRLELEISAGIDGIAQDRFLGEGVRAGLKLEGVDLRPWLELGGLAAQKPSGLLDLDVSVQARGTQPKDVRAQVLLNRLEAKLAGFEARTSQPMQASFDGREARLQGLDLVLTGDGRLKADAGFNLETQAISAQFDASLNLAPLEPWTGQKLEGLVQTSLHASGTPSAPKAAGTLDVLGPKLRGMALGDVRTTLDVTPEWATVLAKALGEQVELKAAWPLAGAPEATADLALRKLDLRPWLEMASLPAAVAPGGVLSLESHLKIPASAPAQAQGTIDFQELALDLGDYQLRLSEPGRASFANEALRIEALPLSLQRQGQPASPLSIQGEASASKLDLRLDGSLPLDFAAAFAPTLESLEGVLELAVSVQGTPSEPLLGGALQLQKSRVVVAEPRLEISDLEGRIELLGRRISIPRIKMIVGGGLVKVDGGLLAGQDFALEADLGINASGVHLDLPELGLSLASDAELTYRGPVATGLLQGKIKINQLDSTAKLSPVELLQSLTSKTRVVAAVDIEPGVLGEEKQTDELGAEPTLNLAISSPAQAIHFQSELAQATAQLDLQVVGKPSVPGVLGRVVVNDGSVDLYSSQFQKLQGTILFEGDPYALNPSLSLQAVVEKSTDETITLKVGGKALNPVLSLTSSSNRSQSQIVQGLVKGSAPAAEAAPAQSLEDQAAGMVLQRATSQASSVASEKLSRALGVQVELVPPPLEKAPLLFAVGKQLSEAFFFKFYKVSASDASDILEFRYELSDQISVEGRSTETESKSLKIRFRKRFD